ncbi:MAG: M56 family metallopeptidase [Saprospiraceae bacterium]|nr:M56 family metallopeptidase [Saprospiraceae bacterium]
MENSVLDFAMDVANAFSWMLLHSLWIAGFLTGVIMLIEKSKLIQSNHARNALYKSVLVFFVFCVSASFVLEYLEILNILPFIAISGDFSNSNFGVLAFGIWLIGFAYFGMRYIRSYRYISEIKNNGGHHFPEHWYQIFESLKSKMAIPVKIIFLHSNKVQSAFVYGVLKPMVVVPTCWVNKLSYQEAECILAHELSHLKAGDHVFNLICHFCDLVFFFNPGVQYLSSKVKFHRELCADEQAVSFLPDLHAYASLILKLGEDPSLNNHHRIVAFATEKNQLLKRVKNLLRLPVPMDYSYKIPGFIFLSAFLAMVSVFMDSQKFTAHFLQTQTNHLLGFSSVECADNSGESLKSDVIKRKKVKSKIKAKPTKNINEIDQRDRTEIVLHLESKDLPNPNLQIPINEYNPLKAQEKPIAFKDSLKTIRFNQYAMTIKSEYLEPMLIDQRTDLKKWIQLITEEALQSNLRNLRVISESEAFRRSKENRNKLMLLEELKNIRNSIPNHGLYNTDGSVIN